MPTIKGNSFGPSGSTQKTASPDGLKTMNVQGAGKGVNPNKGYPTTGNMSGDRGGSPGISDAGNGSFRETKHPGNVHMGADGSGHNSGESKRATSTGFGLVHKSIKGKL